MCCKLGQKDGLWLERMIVSKDCAYEKKPIVKEVVRRVVAL